ncbi:conserved protein of unknown function [Nitrospira defluvii]|jgi:phage terminase small subunit|uniref:Terminase small subunit n=1 Tax=Nitrospira defluvii TaxID=330214 RepID=D8P8Q1_9BACT|nr:conserved protein of unknown function [Nitrospira defluvii]
MSTPRTKAISPPQEAFCLLIVAGHNQSDAYRKAYDCTRMKAKTINEKASRMMALGKIKARVAELIRPVIATAQMSREQWLEQIARVAMFDPRKMFDAKGYPIGILELGENEAAALAGFECYEDFAGKGEERKASGYTKKFRLVDRLRALELYGKGMAYYAERQEHTGKDGGPIKLETTLTAEEAYVRMVRGN